MPTTRTTSNGRTKTKHPGIYARGNAYSVRFTDPAGRQRFRAARTLEEAKLLKAALTADVARGDFRALSTVSFASYASEWVQTYTGRTETGIRPGTRDDYRRDLEGHAIPYFGRRKLSEIELRDVRAFTRELAKAGLAPATVRNLVAPVRALFATALEEGLIRINPTQGLRLAGRAKETAEERTKALSEDELAALIEAMPEDWRLFVRFLAATGLRISEAIALQWGDLERGRIRVRRRIYRGVDDPKSRYGKRDVPLSAGMLRDLEARRAETSWSADQDPIFASRVGKPIIHQNLYRRVYKPAARSVGLDWVGWHTLRHTAASRFFRNGWNAKQVQIVLGHHSPAFTLERYVHLLPDDLPDPSFLDGLDQVTVR